MNIINNALLCCVQKLSSSRSWLVSEPFWGLQPSVTMEYDVLDVSPARWDSRTHIQLNTSGVKGSDCFSKWTEVQNAKEKPVFSLKIPQVCAGEALNLLP